MKEKDKQYLEKEVDKLNMSNWTLDELRKITTIDAFDTWNFYMGLNFEAMNKQQKIAFGGDKKTFTANANIILWFTHTLFKNAYWEVKKRAQQENIIGVLGAKQLLKELDEIYYPKWMKLKKVIN